MSRAFSVLFPVFLIGIFVLGLIICHVAVLRIRAAPVLLPPGLIAGCDPIGPLRRERVFIFDA
jgi:hypothetical protein